MARSGTARKAYLDALDPLVFARLYSFPASGDTRQLIGVGPCATPQKRSNRARVEGAHRHESFLRRESVAYSKIDDIFALCISVTMFDRDKSRELDPFAKPQQYQGTLVRPCRLVIGPRSNRRKSQPSSKTRAASQHEPAILSTSDLTRSRADPAFCLTTFPKSEPAAKFAPASAIIASGLPIPQRLAFHSLPRQCN